MRIFDISMPITEDMNVYKDNPAKRPVITVVSDFSNSSAHETKIEMNVHTGTHIDMPLHILENGKTIESMNLEKVLTKCKVFDFTHAEEKVSEEDLAGKDISEGDFILLKTKNSLVKNPGKHFIYLDRSGAEYLAGKKVCGVGIDSLGIERNQPGHETHKILLSSEIVILEGLLLKSIEKGEYFLIALPINVWGADGAPVRAVLLDGSYKGQVC